MLKIEELSQKHDRVKFDCGVQELNRYLKNIARQHLVKGISRTFVLIEEKQPEAILGFFTLAFCEIHAEVLPRKFAKKYPPRVPAAKLARLTVSKNHQRKGLGKNMMVNALERAMIISRNIGIMGFFVDAKDEKARKYYEQFGFIPMPDNKLQLFLALSSLEQAYQTIS